ncbi:MAG: hypothetical protein NT062_38665, partial [Proteobacteria bacterium]|nr:hypothetical protein [Pseudomonadota bacterium]
IDDTLATLPAGSSTISITIEDRAQVRVTAEATGKIAEGDEAARRAIEDKAAAAGDRKLAAAQETRRRELVQENADRLLRAYEEVRGELAAAVNATTKRALEIRANELGAIESVREGRGTDGSYELTITVKT